MKKFLSLILALTLVASVFTVNVMAATQRTATIKIYDSCDEDTRQEITTVEPGATICVEITVDDTMNLEQIGYAMAYDFDAFLFDVEMADDDYETYIDGDWFYEHFENKKGDYKAWFNAFGSPEYTPSESAAGVNGVINYQWAASSALTTSYEDFIIGKFEVKVADDANGNYTFSFVESGETTVTTTAGEDWQHFVANTATLTVGSGAPAVTAPTFDATTAGDTDGVAIKDTDKKFDNAFAVSATIKPGSATEVGMLFVPEAVNNWEAAAVATYGGKVAGEGTVTFTAAIKNIPRAFQGKDLVMLSKAYAKVGDVVSYGNEVKTTINFGSTGEVE